MALDSLPFCSHLPRGCTEFSRALVYVAIWLTLPTSIINFSRFLLSLHDSNGESYGEEQLVFLKQRAAHVGVDTVGEMIIQTFYPFFQV